MTLQNNGLETAPLFALEGQRVPRRTLPRRELPPDVAYQIIHDELMIDGKARLNVATFVTTDGAPGGAAHVRDLRQEHDRQGRVSADRGDRDALRAHAEPPLERAGGARADWLLHNRVE